MDFQYWDYVIGHAAIKNKIKKWLASDRMPHALIFSGPEGVGKTTFACALAEVLVQRKVFQKGMPKMGDHPYLAWGEDVYFISPITAQLKVEQFRQVREKLILRNAEKAMKVCIIDHAETMNAAFANGMLKIIEEPPMGVIFIIITNQPEILLPTIVSRCVSCHFDYVDKESLQMGLATVGGRSLEQIQQVVQQANGNVVRAFALLEGTTEDWRPKAMEFLRILGTHPSPYAKSLTLAASWGKEDLALFLQSLVQVIHDVMIVHYEAGDIVNISASHREQLQYIKRNWTLSSLARLMKVVEECRKALRLNLNVKTIFDYLCIQSITNKEDLR